MKAHFGRTPLRSSQHQEQTPWLILFTGITSKQNNHFAFHRLDFYLPSFWNVIIKSFFKGMVLGGEEDLANRSISFEVCHI